MTSVMTSRPPARFAAAGTLKGAALDRYKYQSGHVTTHAREGIFGAWGAIGINVK